MDARLPARVMGVEQKKTTHKAVLGWSSFWALLANIEELIPQLQDSMIFFPASLHQCLKFHEALFELLYIWNITEHCSNCL